MPADHEHDEQDAAERPPDDGQPGADAASGPADIDGAADAPPGSVPEGATPKVRRSGDPLADAHE